MCALFWVVVDTFSSRKCESIRCEDSVVQIATLLSLPGQGEGSLLLPAFALDSDSTRGAGGREVIQELLGGSCRC